MKSKWFLGVFIVVVVGQQVEAGKWVTEESINPLDDSVGVYSALFAEKGAGIGSKPVLFVAGCQHDRTRANIQWYEFLGDDTNSVSERKKVTYRFPPAKAKTELWYVDKDDTGVSVIDPIPFLKAMVKSQRLVMQITPYRENPRTAIFDLDGASVAIGKVAEACNWGF